MVPVTLDDLTTASSRFRLLEKRGSFYDMARRLLEAGYDIEGCILFLSTWNFAGFRYATTDFDIDGFKDLVRNELADDFMALARCHIQRIDLEAHRTQIKRIFDRLSSMKGVLYTGATKVMHLKCPELFVIWDAYIRGEKAKKLYSSLPCVVANKWELRQYEASGIGYISFLSDIQERFRDLQYPVGPKTLAKAIDEYHYVNITLPIRAKETEARNQKKRANAQPHGK